ncbi:MAG TPA: YkgJ family cysteine cluster protein [Flavipsychrobacter sp.]|nr:YkgJ family cysteine cluster protein [Flavipsychrobacter sp.]
MLQTPWQKKAHEHQKAFQNLLKKVNQPGGKKMRNDILGKLPDLHEEAFERIDCLQCAHCCKNYSPRFKQPDIKRIARRLKLKEGELISRYLKLDVDNDFVTRSSPCPFLNDDNTCKIYDDRPSDCARYPYTNEDVLLDRVQLTLKNTTVCPITFYVMESILNKIE